MVRVN